MVTSKRTRKGYYIVSCSMCGTGTQMRSEVCVRCAAKLIERGDYSIKATGVIPQPSVDEKGVEAYVQATFWERHG